MVPEDVGCSHTAPHMLAGPDRRPIAKIFLCDHLYLRLFSIYAPTWHDIALFWQVYCYSINRTKAIFLVNDWEATQ